MLIYCIVSASVEVLIVIVISFYLLVFGGYIIDLLVKDHIPMLI